MRRALPCASLVLLASAIACVPPSERVEGRSADGSLAVRLDLSPATGDSVLGRGTVSVAGRPRAVVLHGHWNEKGDGARRLVATLQSDTVPGEHWSLDWSPLSLAGSIRPADTADVRAAVPLTTLE